MKQLTASNEKGGPHSLRVRFGLRRLRSAGIADCGRYPHVGAGAPAAAAALAARKKYPAETKTQMIPTTKAAAVNTVDKAGTMLTKLAISLNAAVDGGVLVFSNATGTSHWFVVGGTSASSPEWAGLFAIVNQARAMAGKGPLGFVNPLLYKIAESARYATDFHDIASGNNTLAGSSVGFKAKAGYDVATGWGTANAANLLADLKSAP